MKIEICVGSSCYLKGSNEIIELITSEIKKEKLEDIITLTGCFCAGKCNRIGVTIIVDEEIYTGVTTQNFKEFWNDKILKKLGR